MPLPEYVKIVEVGPRDGLQNEPNILDSATKIEFINRLSATGLIVIEATSMVNPARIPQLADAEEVYSGINKQRGVSYPVLVPNMKGMQRALAAGVEEIALFTSASESFNQKNINCSVAESLQRFEPVIELATQQNIPIRAYLSCVLGCPDDNDVKLDNVASLAELLYTMGCYEISLGDTLGLGTPLKARELVLTVAERVPMKHIAVHFHDTRGQALANIFACLQVGVTTIDAAVAGLGGCPYANGASGNVATEDLVYMLKGMEIETGIDLDALVSVGQFICEKLGRENQSKLGRIGAPK